MRMHRYTHICTCTKTVLSVWLTAGVSVWLIKWDPYNHMVSPLCKYSALNDTVRLPHAYNPTVYIISPLKTWALSTCGTTPPYLTPLCAVCHHSQHKLGKPHRLKLSSERCCTNWHKCKHKIRAHKHKHTHTHWMLTDEFLFLAVYSLCWQFRHILPVHKRSSTHAHTYKENMYTHPDTHIHSDLLSAE